MKYLTEFFEVYALNLFLIVVLLFGLLYLVPKVSQVLQNQLVTAVNPK